MLLDYQKTQTDWYLKNLHVQTTYKYVVPTLYYINKVKVTKCIMIDRINN